MEIRKVPENWQHPKDAQGHYKPLYNKFYEDAVTEWKEGEQLWANGKHPDQLAFPDDTKGLTYIEYMGEAPEAKYYYEHRYTEEEACCFQVYETISEGTPISPVFKTLKEVEQWIIYNGLVDPQTAKEFCNRFEIHFG